MVHAVAWKHHPELKNMQADEFMHKQVLILKENFI